MSYDELLQRLQFEIAAALPDEVRVLIDISMQDNLSSPYLQLDRRLRSVQVAQVADTALEIPCNDPALHAANPTLVMNVVEAISECWRDFGVQIATDTASKLLSIADGIDLVTLMTNDKVNLHSHRKYRWNGDCPMSCSKKPKMLVVFKQHGVWRWLCWENCNQVKLKGKPRNALDYVRLRYNVDYFEAIKMLNINQSAPPPNNNWRKAMEDLIQNAESALWNSDDAKRALQYLHKIGLNAKTIGTARLGYTSENAAYRAGSELIAIPRGIVIPHYVDNEIRRVTIRLPRTTAPKYYTVPHSIQAPFWIEEPKPSKPAVLVENALDALVVWHAASDLATPVAMGATGFCGMHWLTRIATSSVLLLAFDADQAGDEIAKLWKELTPRAMRWRPGNSKKSVFDRPDQIRAWIQKGLQSHGAPYRNAKCTSRC